MSNVIQVSGEHALRELRRRLEDLPRFEMRFGGAEMFPATLIRHKVLSVVDEFIREEKERTWVAP